MVVDLKVVSTSVRHDARVVDVYLPDAPPVEPRFFEDFIKQPGVTDLQVAHTRAQASHAQRRQDATHVFMVCKPTSRTDRTIYIWKFQEFDVIYLELVRTCGEDHLVAMRSELLLASDHQFERVPVRRGSKFPLNLSAE